MIKSASGWVLSPAYDLLNVSIVLPEDIEELALTLNGKKRKFKRRHFESLGVELDMTPRQITGAFNRMIKNKSKAIALIEQSFLSETMKLAYRQLLDGRFAQLAFSE